MNNIINGTMHVFGSNIDTDQIYPGCYLEQTDPQIIASHCLEGADPDLAARFCPGDIIIAGTNFGCGSSREHAAIALKSIGCEAVIAKSFARIFFRNGINMGLPLLVCPDIDDIAGSGKQVEINLAAGIIRNTDTGATAVIEPISEYTLTILNAGGIKALLREEEKS